MSKLQELARKRNSSLWLLSGIRMNLRQSNENGIFTDKEHAVLSIIEDMLHDILSNKEKSWKQLKKEL